MTIIRNKQTGLEITGKVEDRYVDWFNFAIEGTTTTYLNSFCLSDWDIIEPLPTAPGLYQVDGGGVRNFRHLMLTMHGKWYWVDFTARDVNGIVDDYVPHPEEYNLTPVFT